MKKYMFSDMFADNVDVEFKKRVWNAKQQSLVAHLHGYINGWNSDTLRKDLGERAVELERFVARAYEAVDGEARLRDLAPFGIPERGVIYEATIESCFSATAKRTCQEKLLSCLTALMFGRSIVRYNTKAHHWQLDTENLELIGSLR
jgi:hypothetical protein